MASTVKLENAPERPSIHGISPVDESENVKIWVDKAHVDRFIQENIINIMSNVAQLAVNLQVEVGIGNNWAEAH